MRISDLMTRLHRVLEEYGDRELYIPVPKGTGRYDQLVDIRMLRGLDDEEYRAVVHLVPLGQRSAPGWESIGHTNAEES